MDAILDTLFKFLPLREWFSHALAVPRCGCEAVTVPVWLCLWLCGCVAYSVAVAMAVAVCSGCVAVAVAVAVAVWPISMIF